MNPIHISIFFKTRKMPNVIMDRFVKRSMKRYTSEDPMPAGHDIAILKDRFMKNPSNFQFWPHKLSCFRYLTKKVSVVSLIQGMPTGPYLCLYQILSKYFKPFRSYEVHKNLA